MFGFGQGSTNQSNSGTQNNSSLAENNVEDIPKEELMQLCMKMNKRMQAMETKGKELVKKKGSLLGERQKLLDLIKSVVVLPINSVDDQDLEMSSVESAWNEWRDSQQNRMAELEAALVGKKTENGSNDLIGISDLEAEQKQNEKVLLEQLQTKVSKYEIELQRFRQVEQFLKDQQTNMEKVVIDKNKQIEDLKRDLESIKTNYEEKLVHVQMQSKSKDDSKDKELIATKKQVEKQQQQLSAIQTLIEEKDLTIQSNREMIKSLQGRLIELEPELSMCKDRLREQERNSSATALLKAEQESLLSHTRKDLKNVMDERDELSRRAKELEEYKVKAEGQLLKLAQLQEQVNTLQISIDDKTSLITRLRTEQQASERNHAMRTAMLATCEAQLETLQKELASKDAGLKEAVNRVTTLQISLSAMETRLEERVAEYNKAAAENEAAMATLRKNCDDQLFALKKEQEEQLDAAKKDFAKKSAMARSLLSEKEEEVRILSARVQELQEEISSGAPTERKIFEYAKAQAQREATLTKHSVDRDIAFEQLQRILATKDFELARVQHMINDLNAEMVELRRNSQRNEGLNMDYLKNIVIQYMTLPIQSNERSSLVPVIATILQFNPKELSMVQKSTKEPVWQSKPAKEVRRSTSLFGGYTSSPPVKVIDRSHSNIAMPKQSSSPVYIPPAAVAANPPGAAKVQFAPMPDENTRRLSKSSSEMSQSDRDFHEKLQKINIPDVLNIRGSFDEAESH